MSQKLSTCVLLCAILIVFQIPIVVAWDWGDFHKFAVVFFTILGFGLGFGGILIVFYFGFLKNCLKTHQEEVLHTHRAFHPWPPGSAQWDRQKTYRESTGRNKGQSEEYHQNQYQNETAGHKNTNIPYNTLTNQPYDGTESFQQAHVHYPTGYGHQQYFTNEYPQKTHISTTTPYILQQPTTTSDNFIPSHTHVTTTTHFTPPEGCAYNNSYQKSSAYPYQMSHGIIQQQPPYITYPESDMKSFNRYVAPLSPQYTSIHKETSTLRRSLSPGSKISQMINEKSENVIVRNTTLVNQQQYSTDMKTHTYI
uniref:Adhesive plaque matrix protein-like n=1 Tax=Parastrongyloides trichosuri TaxID=131310 RepID=A0A0N4ZHQ2_PARTI